MPQRHRATVDIHLAGIRPSICVVGQRDDSKGFVDLKEIDIGRSRPHAPETAFSIEPAGAVVNHSGACA